jgi:thiol:disulfide interchange protein DsbC
MLPVARLVSIAALAMLAACSEPDTPVAEPDAAADAAEGIGTDHAALAAVLAARVGAVPDAIGPSPAEGMLEARWGSSFAYVTPDGQHVIYGDLVDLDTGESITETRRRTQRLQALNELDDTISFLPEDPKHVITVFTDIDCGYCRKMHSEIDDYHAQGIGIRYAFYPRSGPGTESFRKAEAVWCSEDRQKALTAAKDGDPMQGDSSCANPVLAEYQLGQQLGLRGTPMIVLADGEVVNGYVPAAALSAQLAARAER